MTSKPQLIYHQLDEPFFPNPYGENSGISALHDLYPGRPLTTSDGFDRYEIVPEDPEGARRTFLNSRRETQEYANFLVDRAIADGGGDKNKVLVHAIDDPSSVINDPDLKNAQMQTPAAENDGNAFKVGATPSAAIVNESVRGRQPEGNARSEGLADSPFIPGTTGAVLERFENSSASADVRSNSESVENKEQNYDPMLSHLFLAATIILLIIALVTILGKKKFRI